MLTGETRSSIGIVKPNSPFDIRKGKFGIGAIEPFFRYEYLDITNKSSPTAWPIQPLGQSHVQTHVGFNWHLTQYIKFYFDWNHAEFNQPVLFSPGNRQLTSELFLARIQVYF